MELMEELYYNIQEIDLEEFLEQLLEELAEQFDIDKKLKVEIYNIFKDFLCNIRLWIYKGATINEINSTAQSKK